MSNPGNTGQRYKMSKLVALEARGNVVVHKLECGHSYEATWNSSKAAEWSVLSSQKQIGKRQRCTDCEVQS